MGVARSNSPSTVSHRAGEEVKKDLQETLHKVERAPSKQQQHDEELMQAQWTEIVRERDGDSTAIVNLKQELKALLSANNGSAKDKEVVDIIAKLSERSPCLKGLAKLDCFPGDFFSLSVPNFPGRLETAKSKEGEIVQYTLGRLSFNIFQPNELVCTVRSIQNQVHPQHNESESESNGAAVFSYHFIVDLTIHTPDGDLDATLINRGFCRESERRKNRMSVTFTGGTLIPGYESASDKNTMLALWKKTFAKAYEKANEERSFLGWICYYCIVLFLGLTLPTDWKHFGTSRCEHSFHFDIKRPPKGFFDVLYLDDDMRITKGNRGTITVLERASSNGFSQ